MGKQCCFYVMGDDIKKLYKMVRDSNAWIIYTSGERITEDKLDIIGNENARESRYPYGIFYIVNENSSMQFVYQEKWDRTLFERYESMGYIELSFCEKTTNGKISHGRMYFEPEILKDEGWVKQPEEYNTLYNKMRRQIAKEFIKGGSYYMGNHFHEEYMRGTITPEWWKEPSEDSGKTIKTNKTKDTIANGDKREDDSSDIAAWLREYSGNEELEVKSVTCRSCGSDYFEIIADQDEGAIQVKCTKCGEEKFLLDSEEIWEEAEPEQMVCPECGDGKEFNLRVGFSRREEGGDVDWVYIGSKCTKCGAISSFLDWEIDYGPTDEMEQNL